MPKPSSEEKSARLSHGGMIEIEIDGALIRVSSRADKETLRFVLAELRRHRDSGSFRSQDLIATQPVDFRKGIHGLVALVTEALNANPYCGNIFIFRSKRADRLKLIAWMARAWFW